MEPNQDLVITLMPLTLVLTVGIALLIAFIVLAFGRRLPRQGDWLIGFGFAWLFSVLTWNLSAFIETGSIPWEVIKGWIGSRREAGAVTIGLLYDSVGLGMSVLILFVSGAYLLNRMIISQTARPERIYSSLLIVSVGACISWLSSTAWTAIFGLAIVAVGGFFSHGVCWEQDPEAAVAGRFLRERTWGMVLALIGCGGLASSGVDLQFASPVLWDQSPRVLIATVLLFVGVFLQLNPYPFLGWALTRSRISFSSQILLTQVLPGWAAFAIIFRFSQNFQNQGVLAAFSWISVGSALACLVCGLLQESKAIALRLWLAGGFAMAVSALANAGPWSCFGLLLGFGFAGIALSRQIESLTLGEASTGKKPELKTRAVKFLSVLAGASGSGVIGFIVAGGSIRWFALLLPDPFVAVAYIGTSFGLALLLWKTVWGLFREKFFVEYSWLSQVYSFVVLLLSFGLTWTGTVTGGALPENIDQILPSVFGFFGGSWYQGNEMVEIAEDAYMTASWLHWSALLLAMILAYLSTAPVRNFWIQIQKALPRPYHFVASGYQTDQFFIRLLMGLVWIGNALEKWVETKVWGDPVPGEITKGLTRVSVLTNRGSEILWQTLSDTIRVGVGVPSKILQLIQNGDVQWYLFFVIGTGMVILFKFLGT